MKFNIQEFNSYEFVINMNQFFEIFLKHIDNIFIDLLNFLQPIYKLFKSCRVSKVYAESASNSFCCSIVSNAFLKSTKSSISGLLYSMHFSIRAVVVCSIFGYFERKNSNLFFKLVVKIFV